MKTTRCVNFFGLCMALAFGLAHHGRSLAHEYYGQGFTLVHPWANATVRDAVQAPLFFKITSIESADKLISVQADWVETIELRTGGIASPESATALSFEPGPDREFVATGAHLWLRGMKNPMQWGRSYPMTFVFEKSGAIPVMVSVGAH